MLFSPPFIPFHSLLSCGGIVMLLSSTHLRVLSRSCLIPSIYSRSAVQIISFLFFLYLVLTGVLCPFAQVLSVHQASHIFPTGVLFEFVSSLFLFSNGVFSTLFIFVVFFLHFAQPLKVRGFTHWSKKQLSLPLIFLFLFPPVPS